MLSSALFCSRIQRVRVTTLSELSKRRHFITFSYFYFLNFGFLEDDDDSANWIGLISASTTNSTKKKKSDYYYYYYFFGGCEEREYFTRRWSACRDHHVGKELALLVRNVVFN